MFKVGDVLEFNQSYSVFITNIYSSKFFKWVNVEGSMVTPIPEVFRINRLDFKDKVKFKSFLVTLNLFILQ